MAVQRGAVHLTSGLGVISIMGPNARALLQSLSPNDLSHEAFRFAHSREIELGYALVRAARITYVGELGWELYIPTEFTTGVYDTIVAAGAPFGLAHAGYHALDSLRIEKAYRHWGHDTTDEDTPLEAGLGFAVKFDKPGGFIGREALLKDRKAGPAKRLLQFRLLDPQPLLYHNEPIWHEDAWSVTSPPAPTAIPSAAPSALATSIRPGHQTRQRPASASRWPGTVFRQRFRQGRCTIPETAASAADGGLTGVLHKSASKEDANRPKIQVLGDR